GDSWVAFGFGPEAAASHEAEGGRALVDRDEHIAVWAVDHTDHRVVGDGDFDGVGSVDTGEPLLLVATSGHEGSTGGLSRQSRWPRWPRWPRCRPSQRPPTADAERAVAGGG